MTHKILVVEDEKDIRELIHFNLYKVGYEVSLARNGDEAINLAKEKNFDLILLDLMLPVLGGLDVCRIIREDERTQNIPIIMLTAKGEEQDVVTGLEAGADDYITKPFSPKILLARVKAKLRKHAQDGKEDGDVIRCHNINIDPNRRIVKLNDKEMDLTYSEFQLLLIMAKKPGWVFSRAQLVNLLRGENHAITDRSVDVQIVGLRKKLKEFGELIQTVRGVGYRMKEIVAK